MLLRKLVLFGIGAASAILGGALLFVGSQIIDCRYGCTIGQAVQAQTLEIAGIVFVAQGLGIVVMATAFHLSVGGERPGPKVNLTKRQSLILGTSLVVLIGLSATFYGLGYVSSRNLNLQLVNMARVNSSSLCVVQYGVTVEVVGNNLLDVSLTQGTLSLVVDGFAIDQPVGIQDTILVSNGKVLFSTNFGLIYSTTEVKCALGSRSSNNITITYNALSSSMLYAGRITIWDTERWTF